MAVRQKTLDQYTQQNKATLFSTSERKKRYQ